MVTLGVGIAGSGRKTGQRMPRLGHSEHPQVSAIKMECCPPSPWNGVRHGGGTLSAISLESCPPSRGIRNIRAEREDLCFEFERLLLDQLGSSVTVADEVVGFRYFDSRDLLGFVDGTANPTGHDIGASTLVGSEDQAFAGGSYLVVQKYLHQMQPWARLAKDEQERIIGREIVSNVELPDATSGQKSHKTLATIVDDDGTEHDILRDNMPFGRPGQGEYGTYFIGYSRHLWVTQKMLERMFLGDPPGMHDRLLDFSTAHTGAVFFAPAPRTLSELVEAVQA
ncbi:Dyp-type peroxidase [Achromobacter ruhlandii]|uniref:Dyp-type peroxidase n=1 Tax=Achromobacter ruhlandii TaxID=72557 RepID=UPI0020C600B7|nr:Dyp-type peroxidase [Achromobacter ruhlandii]